ncbi:YceI family protein [Porphyrobacter sp. LM 6]|uniref:YceI family protein n=1 Tax=Porphyrobacter sp. LM 6 TaxID=1896196 RepID=UPI0008465E20|nr:YceI family protein [Porphyrobacter sp. LM 6]AOL94741.1 Polyisoprenoid-binding protein YceI [Porphyrobacter sp. LM 6]
MKRLALAAAAALMTGTIALAPTLEAQGAPQAPGAQDPARVAAGTYTLDPLHTLVDWQVSHFGFNDYIGLFGNISGTMTLDPANINASKFDIAIPIADVTVASTALKSHLLRPGKDGGAPDFFGAEPGMTTFTSTSVTRTGQTTANVSGMLTINGKSAPVTLAAEFVGAGTNPYNKKATVGFHARAVIDRTQWGINYGVPFVGKDVTLTISAAFEKQ